MKRQLRFGFGSEPDAKRAKTTHQDVVWALPADVVVNEIAPYTVKLDSSDEIVSSTVELDPSNTWLALALTCKACLKAVPKTCWPVVAAWQSPPMHVVPGGNLLILAAVEAGATVEQVNWIDNTCQTNDVWSVYSERLCTMPGGDPARLDLAQRARDYTWGQLDSATQHCLTVAGADSFIVAAQRAGLVQPRADIARGLLGSGHDLTECARERIIFNCATPRNDFVHVSGRCFHWFMSTASDSDFDWMLTTLLVIADDYSVHYFATWNSDRLLRFADRIKAVVHPAVIQQTVRVEFRRHAHRLFANEHCVDAAWWRFLYGEDTIRAMTQARSYEAGETARIFVAKACRYAGITITLEMAKKAEWTMSKSLCDALGVAEPRKAISASRMEQFLGSFGELRGMDPHFHKRLEQYFFDTQPDV